MEFTGEFFIPGKVEDRIEQDHLERYKFARGFIRDKNVLDIACGVGYGSVEVLEGLAASYTGVDINQSLINYANENYASIRTHFYINNILTFKEDKFDIILCFETIEHIPEYLVALRNLYSLLNTNGTLFISSPNRIVTSPDSSKMSDRPANEFHSQEFTPSELKDVLKSIGFTVKGIYGQRQRIWIPVKYLRLRYNKYFKPDYRKSSVVNPVWILTPRYFIIVASKNK